MQKQQKTAYGESLAAGDSERYAQAADQPSEETARILDQLALLRDDKTLSDPSGRLFLERAIDFLCATLVRHRPTVGALDASAPRRGLATWQVKRVTSYMRDRLDEEIGLDELASVANLSRFHFCTAFRMATGNTPLEWLTHERMARAKALLADPRLRITEVALAVGYATPSAFTAVFRKVVGQTPTEFRRRL